MQRTFCRVRAIGELIRRPSRIRSTRHSGRDWLCRRFLLARELEDGSLELVDGHLRADTTPDQEVPVLVLDVTEAEADKLLGGAGPG